MDKEKIEQIEDPADPAVFSAIQSLSESLLMKRDEAVAYRHSSGVEQMWKEDDENFDGGDGLLTTARNMIEYATGEATKAGSTGPQRSQVVVNIIRGKCETAEGRFAEILLPTDDKNWGLKETPVPEIAKAMKDNRPAAAIGATEPLKADGRILTMSDVAKMDLEKIKEKMKAMETEIHDNLTECHYNAELRKLISDAVRTGTGIIKGPNIIKKVRKVWIPVEGEKEHIYNLKIVEDFKPASKTVSCWDIYPDPDCTEDLSNAGYFWESDMIRAKEVRDLYGVPGYLDKEIVKVLYDPPVRTKAFYDEKDKRHMIKKTLAKKGDLYEMWTYSGDITREDLEAMGINLKHDEIAQSFSGVVVFVNDRPIKVELNEIDTGELPYDFFQWTSVRDLPWGIGVPRMMAWLQRILNAAFRAMMDNAGDSSGANIVIGPGVEPVDEVWEITGKKIWRMIDEYAEDGDVRKAFQQFQIANNQKDLEAVIELVLKFVDLETSIPTIFQGEQQKMPETLGATNIMVDAHNVGLRSRVKRFDDQITVPHITRYYHWLMQYSEKAEIKGDFNVDPRGTSVLLQKDQRAQTLMQVMAYKNDPDAAILVDWEKALKKLFSALNLDIIKSEEDYKKALEDRAKMPQQQDPRIAAAEMRAQTDIEGANIKAQIAEKELQAKLQDAREEREFKYRMKEMDQNIKMMEFAQNKEISLDQIKAKLADSSAKLKTQVYLAGPDKKGPQVAEPLVEPEGRAEDGKAYQD